MECVRACPAGCEVFNTYGQRSDAQLLHMYGFVLGCATNARNSTLRLACPLVRDALAQAPPCGAAALRSRLAVAAAAGLLADASLDDSEDGFVCFLADPLPRELVLLLALLHAPADCWQLIARCCAEMEGGGVATLPALQGEAGETDSVEQVLWHCLTGGSDDASTLLSLPVTAALRRLFALRRAQYPEPEPRAPDKEAGAAIRWALELRRSELAILEAALEALPRAGKRGRVA